MDVHHLVLFRCWDYGGAYMDVYHLVYPLFRFWDYGGTNGRI